MAVVRSDWEMPEPPVPDAVPTYYLDGGECYLSWVDWETREPVLDGGSEIEIGWPFGPDEIASRTELEALGFRDVEE